MYSSLPFTELIPLVRILSKSNWMYELRIDLQNWDGEQTMLNMTYLKLGVLTTIRCLKYLAILALQFFFSFFSSW